MAADVVEFVAGGLVWRAESAHAEAVRGEVAARLDALASSAGVEVVKRNLVRTVMRVPLASGARVIVKRYAVRGLSDRIKYRFVPSRALAEWTAGRALAAAGVPTAVPVAMAERRDGGTLLDAALVVPEIPDALALNEFVARKIDGTADADARRARLFDELVKIVRTMHDAGFVHRDLHGGNLLITGSPDAPRIFVIDLHSVRGPGRPSDGALRTDRMKLLHSMRTCSTPAERARMFAAFTGSRAHDAALEPELEAMERRRAAGRTAKSMHRSSRLDISARGGFTIHHPRVLDPAALLALVPAHEATLAKGGVDVLKRGGRSALTRQTLATPDGPRRVVVKEYLSGALVERLKNCFRTSRAVAAWKAGNGLIIRWFDAAAPIALLYDGRGPAMSRAFLVMEDLGEDARLDLVALARFAGALDDAGRRDKRELVTATARLVRSLHAGGVYHGDLKAVNLFVRATPKGPRIVLADYDRVEFGTGVDERRRVKNLAQLSASVAVCVSLADRLRFFREYAGEDASLAGAWKDWFRRVMHECRGKIVVRMNPIE
jgi:tRNA A-37 threonylcarbamoyl transferase component Bud32